MGSISLAAERARSNICDVSLGTLRSGACHPKLASLLLQHHRRQAHRLPQYTDTAYHRHRVHRMRTGGSRPRRTGRAAMPAQPSSPCALGGPSWPLARVSPRRPGRRHSSPSFFPSSVGEDGGPEHHAVIRAPARLTASEAVLDMLTGQLPCCHPHVACRPHRLCWVDPRSPTGRQPHQPPYAMAGM